MTARRNRAVGPSDDEQDVVLIDVFRRWWLRILFVAVVLAGLGAGYASTRSPTYTSTVRVALARLPGNPMSSTVVTSSLQVPSAMTSELALVTSSQVADAVRAKLGGDLAVRPLNASVATNTNIIVIRFRDRAVDRSQRGAQLTAQAYLDLRAARARAMVAGQLAGLQVQVRFSTAKLRAALTALKTTPPPAGADSQVAIYASQLAKQQQSVGQLRATSFAPGYVLDQPGQRATSDSPPGWIYPVLGALLGLAATGLLAVRRTRRGRVVRGAGLSAIRGRPILGTVRSRRFGTTAVTDVASLDGVYAQIRTGVLAGTPSGSVLALCPIGSDESLGDIAVDLAASLRSAGFTTAVIDASPSASDDMRRPADFVIVSAPPASTPEGMTMALAADGMVLFVRDGITTWADTHEVVERMEQVGVSIIGVVIISGSASRRYPPARSAAALSEPVPSSNSTVDDVLAGASGP